MTTPRSIAWTVLALALPVGGVEAQSERVVSSDPELAAAAGALLPDLARRSGMELRDPVRIETRSRSELARYLEAKLDEDLPPEEARDRVDAYALLGLVPEGLRLRPLLLELYGEQVAGFYEPDSTALYVLDDQPPEALEALLVHELVHALQDQAVDLRALSDPERGSDRSTAAMATIEGHATLVMFEHLTEQMSGAPVDLGAVPDFAAQVAPALEAMTAQFPALARAPRVLRETLIFPYVDGATFVQRLWKDGRRESPFGRALPLSTEQVRTPGAAPPLELVLEPREGRAVRDDTLGQLELGILAEDVLGLAAPSAAMLVAGWDGDRWLLVEHDDGSRSLAYGVVWESERARGRFVERVRSTEGAFGGPVTVEALEIDGRAASLLLVGRPGLDVSLTLADGPRTP